MEFVVDLWCAGFVFGEPVDDFGFGFFDGEAVEEVGVDGRAGTCVGLAVEIFGGLDGAGDGEVECFGKVPVALVLTWDGHDGAGAIAHEDIIGSPDLDGFAGDGVFGVEPEVDAGFVFILLAFDVRTITGGFDIFDEGFDIQVRRAHVDGELDDGVFGGDDHIGRAENGVGAGGEDAEGLAHFFGVAVEDWEVDFGANRPSDPFGLLDFGGVWPVQIGEPIEEAIGVGGDAEHPLAEWFAVDGEGAAFGFAIDDFFVGQSGAEFGTPVDDLFAQVGEAIGVDDCFFGFFVECFPWACVGAVGEVAGAGVFGGVGVEFGFAGSRFKIGDEFFDGAGFAIPAVCFDIKP